MVSHRRVELSPRSLAVIAHKLAGRVYRRIASQLTEAHKPPANTMDSFDYDAAPMISQAKVRATVAGDSWLGRHANFPIFVPTGGNKSRLAAASGMALIETGWRALLSKRRVIALVDVVFCFFEKEPSSYGGFLWMIRYKIT